ncbi:aldo/keto reductase [Galbitalea sp. SE-J8]|uniref:aldo/keto reductase n=1 Tax=Galbitalea sp. SE-J8 TaxID=3054952 RepID=UPI00259CF673|nr:aldo/keto reductase [Galbitalea sp. SE-J8]MDM4762579.1 aldo/keto reductase [Galbitalea sp. SE-J8]
MPDGPAVAATTRTRLRRVGSSDLTVFPLAMSGNVFGWTTDGPTTEAILDVYAAGGGNFIDTADSYASGRSEFMIGSWMRSRGNRDDLVVATKIGKSVDHPGLGARAITRAVNASLERLRTDRIDLLYLHVDDSEVPFDETLLAVDALIGAGKVRYFGGSDHTGDRLIEARIACGQLGVAPMIALQNRYNLMHRAEYEGDLARVARSQELGVMPRFALASGFLTGKYRSRADLDEGTRGTEVARYLTKRGMRVLASLDHIAAAHEVPVASVALAWLLSKPYVVAPVASASQPSQVAALLQAPTVQLTRAQVAELDRISAV